jgi:predicted nucleotidyltransferase
VIDLLTDNRDAIADLCRRYGVESLDVFGSAATGAFDERTSDVDFIARFADMSPGIANRYLDFVETLEELLGRPVDVMFDGPITNPFLRRSVEASRERVFEGPARQAAV